MPTSRSEDPVASAVWRCMFTFLIQTGPLRAEVLSRYGLSPNDSRALNALDARDGRPMGSLADEWGCDASNATLIVNRLQKLGLAERRESTVDRRIKLVRLTSKGARLKSVVFREFYRPPAALLALTTEQLSALQRALRPLERPAP